MTLAPKDILSRAFAGSYYFVFPRLPFVICFIVLLYLERPLFVSEEAKIFNLGLEDVCALVEATGRCVANKVSTIYNQPAPYPGLSHYALFCVYVYFISRLLNSFLLAAKCQRELPRRPARQESSSSEGESGADTAASGDETEPSGGDTGDESKDDVSLSELKRRDSKRKKHSRTLTTEMFHRYPFIRLFATGPRNRENSKHKFYCRFCKKNFSLRTKGRGEIKKHFRSRQHFSLDQKYRLQ